MIRHAVALACAVVLAPVPAFAWGAQGHRIVSGAAMRALPATLPAFLRTPAAHDEVALLGPEADRVKGAGPPMDFDEDPAHYVDLGDDGRVGSAVSIVALPRSRRDYDTALREGPEKTNEYAMGYLPYALADGWERLVRDFAYWRVDVAGEKSGATADDRAFFAFDRTVREAVTLRDIGYWGHFVGDASQPLHVSVHYNGWEPPRDLTKYPNPNGYSNSTSIHARFETALVRAVASEDLVAARMTPAAPSGDEIAVRVGAYLSATAAGVPRVYALEAAGAIDAHSPEATAFVLDRLAAGASRMRDFLIEAWAASAAAKVGYPPAPVSSIETGATPPTRAMLGLGD